MHPQQASEPTGLTVWRVQIWTPSAIIEGSVRVNPRATISRGRRLSDWFQEPRRFYPLVDCTLHDRHTGETSRMPFLLIPYHVIQLVLELPPREEPHARAE